MTTVFDCVLLLKVSYLLALLLMERPMQTRLTRVIGYLKALWHLLQHLRPLVSVVERERMMQPLVSSQAKKRNELSWSKELAGRLRGRAEVRTADGSRVDVLTDTCAIEVEWAKKWKESIGQALFYAAATNLQPAIILLMEGEQDEPNFLRCLSVCNLAGIRLVVCDTRSGAADGIEVLTDLQPELTSNQ